jgi:hypothetical protein
VYADEGTGPAGSGTPALAMLSAAIGAGRHDAVLMPSPSAMGGLHACLMSLLLSCTRHGVAVEIVLTPAATADAPAGQPPPAAGH